MKDFKTYLLRVDPLDKFPNVRQDLMLGALGILPSWAAQANEETPEGDSIARYMNDEIYQMGAGPMEGATTTDEGVYEYPEDPPLYPLAVMHTVRAVFYFYEYAMVSVKQDDTITTYRMD